jgi:hypothetical protein
VCSSFYNAGGDDTVIFFNERYNNVQTKPHESLERDVCMIAWCTLWTYPRQVLQTLSPMTRPSAFLKNKRWLCSDFQWVFWVCSILGTCSRTVGLSTGQSWNGSCSRIRWLARRFLLCWKMSKKTEKKKVSTCLFLRDSTNGVPKTTTENRFSRKRVSINS